jgi:anthranilate phosphoribosyltransferase
MHTLTQDLSNGLDLTPAQIETAVALLVARDVPDAEKAAFLVALRTKGETAAEIAGFAKALLAHAITPELDRSALPGPTIDVCGTGGDRQGFFNVSTTVMFTASAAGACVMKHGNRSITSKTGAADVLEELGIKIDVSPSELRSSLERHGLAFIFARSYHPAFAAIGPVRAALAKEGRSTIFNLLGPLLNPAAPDFQLVGIYSADLLPTYAGALRTLGRKGAWVVHGHGTDELTLTGPSQIAPIDGPAFSVTPSDFGIAACEPTELLGGERVENAAIVTGILDGTIRGAKRDMVLLNTAAALTISGIATDMKDGIARAAEAIDSGAAAAKLVALRDCSR